MSDHHPNLFQTSVSGRQDNTPPSALISTEWLHTRLDAADIRVVDARFFLPNENHDARAEYLQAHIPGAVFFDIDAIRDLHNPLPHMLPAPGDFAVAVGALGIGNAHHVVCYDDGRWMGACRAWWMFRTFGHERVSVLDGGLPLWRAAGLPLSSGEEQPVAALFRPDFLPERISDLDAVREALERHDAQVLDARSAARFAGTAPEPRSGLKAGHMPGARNLPYDRLVGNDGRLRPSEELGQLFDEAGVHNDCPVVTTCGSGVSAAVLLFGLHLIGRDDIALYDGSWAEWGSRDDTPVACNND